MSEASAHKLSYVAETTRGTTPTNPQFRALPDTRTTLALTRDTLESERITGTRFPAQPRLGAKGVSGEIPAQLSARAYDDLIASALQGSWVESGVADTITLEEGGAPTTLVEVGDTFTTTANGIVYVDSIDAKAEEVVLRYEPTIAGPAEYSELFGLDSVTIDSVVFEVTLYTDGQESAIVKAGDTRLSFSFLREFSDFAAGKKPFLLFNGVEVASMNLTTAANGLVNVSFTLFGIDQVGPSLTAPANSSVAPAFDTKAFDSFKGSVTIDGVEVCIITDFNITVNNGHAAKYVIGCETSQDPSVAQSMIENSMTIFLEDETFLEKFINETNFAIVLTLEALNGDQMIITLPVNKIGTGTQADVTADGPITMPVNFTSHYDDTLGSHISIQRIYPTA